MINKIKKHISSIKELELTTPKEVENFRIKYLSKKGILSQLFDEFKTVSIDKQIIGKELNILKINLNEKYDYFKNIINQSENTEEYDLSLPAYPTNYGSRHPVSVVRREIIDIFSRIGFSVCEGPEIEDDWHVFSGLNFPVEHPARDMQDTFFIEKDPDILLRTHTSSVQIRAMESGSPPIRLLFPGRVFRNEAISARAHCIFHQIEGLYIDTNVSFADLKQSLLYFSTEFFGENTKIRLRPSFFPFTEPSAELDVSCSICGGKGCNVCKYTGFLEILGCGMVDPNVLQYSGIDNTIYTGFAFGMGIERIAMLKYQINDLRLYFDNDVRFLNQFQTIH